MSEAQRIDTGYGIRYQCSDEQANSYTTTTANSESQGSRMLMITDDSRKALVERGELLKYHSAGSLNDSCCS